MSPLEWTTTQAGVRMPRIVYGTAWKKERTAGLVETAVRAGFRGIDTACQPRHYREDGVGQALARLADQGVARDQLFLQTKFTPLAGQDPDTAPYDIAAPVAEQVAQSFETSQKNLGVERVDSLVLHSPYDDHQQTLEAWSAMEALHRSGSTGQLGVSNCYDPAVFQRLCADAQVKPCVLQNRFYAATGYDAELRSLCAEHGVVYQSFWTLTANKHLLEAEPVTATARRLDRTPAQVFFRFLTLLGIVPLTGTSSESHMNEDLAIFDFDLEPEERKTLLKLLQP